MRALIAAVSLALAGPAFGQAAALTRIGAAGAVKGVVNAQAPGAAAGRVIESGKTLFMNDHVTTNAAGRLQVLLLDETVFTLGPNSDMVLDEFVYDPSNDEGKVAARVTKGVFRFVTGKVARRDPAKMSVKLAAGTIGIRGTIVIGQVNGNDATVILGGPGGQANTDDSRGAFIFDGKMVDEPGYGITCSGGKCSGVHDLSEQANRINALLASALDANNQHAGNGDRSGTRNSGQGAASGRGDSLQGLVDQAANEDTEVLRNNTANDPRSSQDGLSFWDQLRSNQQLGTAVYQSPQVAFDCVGACGANPRTDFNLTVNFGARTYNANVATQGGFGSDSAGTGTQSFASLTGPAQIPITSGNFNGTTFTLFNAGGEVAKTAVMNLKWNNTITGASGTGSASASR